MTKNASILIVDDEEINRRVATLFLERAGYAARAVKDAAEAWAILQQQDFDLVLLDISMPGKRYQLMPTHSPRLPRETAGGDCLYRPCNGD